MPIFPSASVGIELAATWVSMRDEKLFAEFSDWEGRGPAKDHPIWDFLLWQGHKKMVLDFDRALAEIRQKLDMGEIAATGRLNSLNSRRRDIPIAEWPDLTLTGDPVRAISRGANWFRISLPSDRVLNLWPPSKPLVSTATCRRFGEQLISEHIDEHGPDGKGLKRNDFTSAVMLEFGISERKALEIWGETAPDNWKRAGRKS